MLSAAVALALAALAAILGGTLDAAAAVALVLGILLLVRSAFRLVDRVERREEELAVRRRLR
ncbi:MAG TPA: hypothetical protein VHF45_07085 [Thermoleophilaceae bacterium]|nr:hypothetical protein [Thermoleophilaceae bacterium]